MRRGPAREAAFDNPNPNPNPSPIPDPDSNPNPNLCGGVGPERSHALHHRRGLAQQLAEGSDQVARKLVGLGLGLFAGSGLGLG